MMNLQIWWWAAQETKDPAWTELGRKHALKIRRVAGARRWQRHPERALQSRRQSPEIHVQRESPGRIRTTPRPASWSSPTPIRASPPTRRGRAPRPGRSTASPRPTARRAIRNCWPPPRRPPPTPSSICPRTACPWYDFADEGVFFRNRDSSAAAILAGGLLRLAELTADAARAAAYRKQAGDHRCRA